MRKLIFLFLFFIFHLSADQGSLIATLENDPSVLIEGRVNALTQQLGICEPDLIIQGVEPIPIFRTYLGDCQWAIAPVIAGFAKDPDKKNTWDFYEKGYPTSYRKSGELTIGKTKYNRYQSTNHEKGFVNTWRGEISSRTNLKNNYFILDKDEKRHLWIHAADGTTRKYKKSGHETVYFGDVFDDDDEGQEMSFYRLEEEHLSNGNWVFYEYDKKHHNGKTIYLLRTIRTTNPSKSKEYARASFVYPDYKNSNNFSVHGSDGQFVEYHYPKSPNKWETSAPLLSRKGSVGPDQTYDYFWFGWRFENQKITAINGPNGRAFQVQYEPNETRVRTIATPAGTNQELHPIYTLTENEAVDSEGNKTKYFKDKYYRPLRIERYSREGVLQNSDVFVWGSGRDVGNLLAKTILDSGKAPLASKRYFYNGKGDVLEEKLYGNFSGEAAALVLDGQNFPIAASSEEFVKRFRYSEGEPSLLLEEQEENRRILYEYLPETDLVTSRSIYDGQELKLRTAFQYNGDHILVRKVEDDGFVRLI